jgi:hypothetical protein
MKNPMICVDLLDTVAMENDLHVYEFHGYVELREVTP